MRRLLAISIMVTAGAIPFLLVPKTYASICFIPNGCTGTSTTPGYGQLLIGGKNGEYELVASSTFGGVTSVFGRTGAVTAQSGDYTTSLVPEGSNLYYTLTRWASALAGTTTDALAEGANNLYFTTARARAALSATYPIQFASGVFSLAFGTSTSNTWGGTQTFTNNPILGALSGLIYGNSGTLNQVATSSFTINSPLTTSGTAGALVGGTALTIGCQTASASQAGCLSSTDWTTFNNKVSGVWPFTPTTNYGVSVQATTTPEWFQNGVFASSTSHFNLLDDTSAWIQSNGNTLAYATTTNGDTIFGLKAGSNLSTTSTQLSGNSFFGYRVGTALATSTNTFGDIAGNTLFGYRSMELSTTSVENTAFGAETLANFIGGDGSITKAGNNTAVGFKALYHTTSGWSNTAVGDDALALNTTGDHNTGLGVYALFTNTTGIANTGVGENALQTNDTGNENTAVGGEALFANTTGSNNTSVGRYSLVLNTSGTDNVAVGYQASKNNITGTRSIAIGRDAAFDNQSATTSVVIGYAAGFGGGLYNSQGSTFVGYAAGNSVLTGSDWNTLIGNRSGQGITTGAQNVLIGASNISGSQNQVTTGSNNISIGYNVALPSATLSNQLDIGNYIYGTGLSGTGATISSAFIGLGTTTPYSPLTIWGTNTSNNSASLLVSDSASTTLFSVANGGLTTMVDATSSTLRVGKTITGPQSTLNVISTGQVGIGVTNPIANDGSAILAAEGGDTLVGDEANTARSLLFRRNAASVFGLGTQSTLMNLWTGIQSVLNDITVATGPKVSIGTNGTAGAELQITGNTVIPSTPLFDIQTPIGQSATTSVLRITPNGLTGHGTTTPAWMLTVSSSTGPQLALTDGTDSSNAWTLRSIANSLFIATSTYSATSTTAALAIDPNGKLTFNTASSTLLSATTFCLTGDSCRTTWPSGGGGSGIATSSLAATWPILLTTNSSNATYSWGGLSTTSNLVAGHVVYSSGAGSITDVATSSVTFSGPFSGFSALGALVGGSNSTINWTGLSTTSQPSSSNLLVSNGAAGVYGVATSTLNASSPLTGSFTQVGSGGSLGIQAASGSQNGYLSSTDYNLLHTATTTFSSPLVYTLSTNAVTCPTCITSAAAWPWNSGTTYGTTTDATTTPAWFKTGFYASSTSQIDNASTTAISASSYIDAMGTLVTNLPNYIMGFLGLPHQSLYANSTLTASTSPSYAFENFLHNNARWKNTGTGSYVIDNVNGTMTVTTPTSADVVMIRTLWSNILNGYDTIDFDVNFNGYTLLTAGDTPELSFNQSGDRWILLNNFATNGTNGWKHISVPLSKFTSNGDATPSTAGTGTHLDPTATVTNFKLRVYENTAGRTLSIRNVVLSDSTHTLQEDFTQPDLLTQDKDGNGLWKIRSLDVMKVSKDNVASQYTTTQMNNLINALRPLNPTHIAVSVPYDDPAGLPGGPYPTGYMQKWADAVHKAGFAVWHRQTWAAFEGIYSVTKSNAVGMGTSTNVINGTDTSSYLYQIYHYILTHPTQYAPGDIFTPIPEPDNGGINGITTCASSVCQFGNANVFRSWLRDAITVSNYAFEQIGLKGKVYVGYYGVSGFVAFGDGGGNPHGFLDERTADDMKVITMDDYPNPDAAATTSAALYEGIYGQFPLVLGEWGTLNDSSTSTKASGVDSVLGTYANKPYFQGMNYWTVTGGSNENLVDTTTLAPQGGNFDRMRYWYNSGKPFHMATFLGTLDWNPVYIASSTPIAGQALVTTSPTLAVWTKVNTYGWPWTSATNFGVSTNSTTTPTWYKAGVYASSTSQFDNATTSLLTVSNQLWFPGGNCSGSGSSAFCTHDGTWEFNNTLFGKAGYTATIATTATTSYYITPTKFCNYTNVLIPVGNTTTVSMIFPDSAATSIACGTLVNGEWGWGRIQNDSSFPVTLATSTGSNLTFYYAPGSEYSTTAYPIKIPASSTVEIIPEQNAQGLFYMSIHPAKLAGTPQNSSTTNMTVSDNAFFPSSGIWNSSGNVGIGTSTPWMQLSLAAPSLGTNDIFEISTSTATATSSAFAMDKNGLLYVGAFTGATSSPLGQLNFSSNGTSISKTPIVMYNTVDQVTNYERATLDWTSGNVFEIRALQGGTGTARNLQIGTKSRTFLIDESGANGFYVYSNSTSASNNAVAITTNARSPSSGTPIELNINPTYKTSGTAGYTLLNLLDQEITTGTGVNALQIWSASTSKYNGSMTAGTIQQGIWLNTGQLMLGATTSPAMLTVQNEYGNAATEIFKVASTTNAAGSVTNPVIDVFNSGFTGFGTTTPQWGVTISTSGSVKPQLAITDGVDNTNAWTFRNSSSTLMIATSTYSSTSTKSAMVIDKNGLVYFPETTLQSGAATDYWCYDANQQLIRVSAICTTSARRFKKDIAPLTVGLQDLIKLQPVQYLRRDPLDAMDSHLQMGFIADDVASTSAALNEMLVTYVGGGTSGIVQGFRYDQFTALITQSIKDLYAIVMSNKSEEDARITALEAEVAALQKGQVQDMCVSH